MTLPHEPRLAPAFEDLFASVQHFPRIIRETRDRQGVQAFASELRKTIGIPLDDPGHARLAATIGARFSGVVEAGNGRRERRHQFEVAAPRTRKPYRTL